MAFDLSEIAEYTTAEKLKAVDHAIMTVMLGGQGITINGRTLTRANLNALREYRAELVDEESDESTESSGGIALVRFGDRM